MQQSLTISIDQNTSVFYGGMSIGTGEASFFSALDQVPVSMVEKIVVRDERDPLNAKKWVFYSPHDFDTLKNAVEFYPAEIYAVTPHEQEFLRSDEKVYLDPEFLSESHIEEQATYDYMPKSRPSKKPEPESEPEVIDRSETAFVSPEELEEFKFSPEPEPEPEPEPVKEPLVKAVGGQEVRWNLDQRLVRNISHGASEGELLREYHDQAAVEKLPSDISPKQAYLPGERLEITPIAEKKTRFKVNRERSKTPLYMLAGVILMVLLSWLFRSGITADTLHYTAVCMDSRTQLVAESSECKSESPGRTVVYVPDSDARSLIPLSKVPESALYERPSGKVEVKEL